MTAMQSTSWRRGRLFAVPAASRETVSCPSAVKPTSELSFAIAANDQHGYLGTAPVTST